jgi:hypothetical protein
MAAVTATTAKTNKPSGIKELDNTDGHVFVTAGHRFASVPSTSKWTTGLVVDQGLWCSEPRPMRRSNPDFSKSKHRRMIT